MAVGFTKNTVVPSRHGISDPNFHAGNESGYDKVVIFDANGLPISSEITHAELLSLNGITGNIENRFSSLESGSDGLTQETYNRQQADQNLQQQINLITGHESGEDITISDRLNNIDSSIVAVESGLIEEINNRTIADQNLQGQINALVGLESGDISDIKQRLTDAINSLESGISSEAITREQADQNLQSQINLVESGLNYVETHMYISSGELVYVDPTRSNKILSSALTMASFGRNATQVTNTYLEFVTIFSNLSGFILPYNATLVGIGMAGTYGTLQTWTLEVRRNNSVTVVGSLTATNVDKNYSWALNSDFNAGDVVQVYLNGNSISRPSATIYFRRRF